MFRRTVLSAVLAASIPAADLVLLTLFLNPGVALRHDGATLLLVLFLPYLLAGTAGLLLLALLGTAMRDWPRAPRPAIEGLPWFLSHALVAVGTSAALFWLNLLSYRYSIPMSFLRALAGASIAVTASALVLVAVGVDALLFPLRSRAPSAAFVVLACGGAVIVPLALRPQPEAPPRPRPFATETIRPVRRVVLVGIDGLDPRQLDDAVERGALPGFARILKRGAHGPLASFRPTEGPPIWNTIFTGRLPRDHGIKSFLTYRLRGSLTPYELLPRGVFVSGLERAGLVSSAPVTSTARSRHTLWNALNAFGIPTGLVRIWGTYPTERVQGFVLSEYFHLLRKDPARAAGTLYPGDLLAQVQARAVDPEDVDRGVLSQFLDLSLDQPSDPVNWRRELLERGLAPDMTYERAGAVLRAAYDPPFFATYFYGLDIVGHAFTRFAQPERFGNVRPEDVRRYGRVVERYTGYLSQIAGGIAQGLRPGEILIVVSGYGMEPVSTWRRVLQSLTGATPMSGSHVGAPDGIVAIVGDGIRPGAVIRDASVLDITPTILYLMGLPLARDMEGRVFTEMLEDDFARAHPLTYIPSYESLAVTPVTGGTETDLPPLPEDAP